MNLTKTFALGIAAIGFCSTSQAAIIELKMSAPIWGDINLGNGTTHTTVRPFMQSQDIGQFVIRYDTATAAATTYPQSTSYNGAVTYFNFSLIRGGTELYSGTSTGNFGIVNVSNGGVDNISFALFSDYDRYNDVVAGTVPNISTIMPDLSPVYDTNKPNGYGDLFFNYFKLQFHAVDGSLWSDTDLPDMDDLTLAGGASPFVPRYGNTPWSGQWEFREHAPSTNLGIIGTFGAGTYRDDYPVTISVRELKDSNSTVPDASKTGLLLSIGLLSIVAVRRKTNKFARS